MLELIKNPWIIGVGTAVIAGLILYHIFGIGKKNNINSGKSGHGGNAIANGSKSTAIGGRGGKGGLGKGGDGGDAFAQGDGSFSIGGEGGDAARNNRGGKGGRGPLHVLMEDIPDKFKEISESFGITEDLAKKIGKGGDGGNPS